MENKKVSRRDFMRESAIVAAGVAVGLSAVKTQTVKAGENAITSSKILNYNQNMEYRRLGKTNLMVSALSLGGHSGSDEKERYAGIPAATSRTGPKSSAAASMQV